MKIKNRIRAVAAVMLIFAVLLPAGCSSQPSAAGILTGMVWKLKDVSSAEGTVKIQTALNMSGIEAEAAADFDCGVQVKPYKGKFTGSASIKAFGFSTDTDIALYQEAAEDTLKSYTEVLNVWNKTETKLGKTEKMGLIDSAKLYFALRREAGDLTVEKKTVKINGKDCRHVSGNIEFSKIYGLLRDSMKNQIKESKYIDLDQSMDAQIKVDLYVYKEEQLPAALKIDASEIAWNIPALEKLNANITQAEIEISVDSYDKLPDITIPQEAAEAE